ncbi:hypothetical protein NA78x_004949 [Anatilimnocola sp. NA78]|uniref:hypothetical protein n=1 Tax=Anatilimnocola sp. NA78 TaxID=3415683 RepID=UPI003CE46B29
MKPSTNIILILAAFVSISFVGCGGKPKPPPPVAAPTALSLEEWKQITDISDKYDGATLDRLRMKDPRLQNERAWQAFMNQNVIPERMKDIPVAPGQKAP